MATQPTSESSTLWSYIIFITLLVNATKSYNILQNHHWLRWLIIIMFYLKKNVPKMCKGSDFFDTVIKTKLSVIQKLSIIDERSLAERVWQLRSFTMPLCLYLIGPTLMKRFCKVLHKHSIDILFRTAVEDHSIVLYGTVLIVLVQWAKLMSAYQVSPEWQSSWVLDYWSHGNLLWH